jgi:non-specific serine/threonine protein kinase
VVAWLKAFVEAPRDSLDNLPAHLTSFIGREREIVKVKTLLGTARLLTLTGAGGIGKTRLALEAATSIKADFPQGVWLVELAPMTDPTLVPNAVAAALGVRERPGRPLVRTLAEALRTRHLLLVLDNCEHLVATCAALAETLLQACPELRILATSREPLNVAGEIAWSLPPLTLPVLSGGFSEHVDLDLRQRLLASEAVRLFVGRAASALPGFELSDRNARTVAELCVRLDGIPLAIELAAARMKVLGIEQIATRLEDRFRLLSVGARTAPPRHQSLRAAIDWSYELLSAPERRLFNRLSVFAGGLTLEAAEAVCSDVESTLDGTIVLDLIARLVDQSLVLAEPSVDGSVRYRLLETLRQYGREQLAAAETNTTAERRHATYFLTLVERAGPELEGPDQGAWLDRLEVEHDNLRVVLERSLETGGPPGEVALRLGASLWRFWERRGYFSEGRAWLERALDQNQDANPRLRGSALHGAGHLTWRLGLYARARTLHEESLALGRQQEDHAGVARALYGLARVSASQGDYDAAQPRAQESLAIRRNLANGHDAGLSLNVLGEIARYQGDYDRAGRLYEESLALLRESGDKLGIQIALYNLGCVAKYQSQFRRSTALFEESLELSRSLGIRMGIASCLGGLARVAGAQRQHVRAARLFGAAEALCDLIGFPQDVVDRIELERDVAVLRSALAEDALGSAWAEGRGMPINQAIEYGLSTAAAIPRSPGESASLTPRECEVATLISQGLTNREIAAALVITKPTADRHVSNILLKLGLSTRAQVAVWVRTTKYG